MSWVTIRDDTMELVEIELIVTEAEDNVTVYEENLTVHWRET